MRRRGLWPTGRIVALGVAWTLVACSPRPAGAGDAEAAVPNAGGAGEDAAAARAAALAEYVEERRHLVEEILANEIGDRAVLDALGRTPRHRFVPAERRHLAYRNAALPIDEGQTISQPLVVALMTHLLGLDRSKRVLEIGTGSGYQAAILADLAGDVYSIEIVESLGRQADEVLRELGYDVHVRIGDGYLGWPEAAPFDAIIVTCAPDHVPAPLQEQLAEGGRLVIPVGDQGRVQQLILEQKVDGKLERQEIVDVRFVPMTGLAEEGDAAVE